MSSSSPQPSLKPTGLQQSDYAEWERLFRAYVAFYKSSLPDEQYRKTFDRLLDPSKDLYGLVLRDPEDHSKLIGLAHFYPHQTPWSEKLIMHFNDLFIDPQVRSKGYGRAMILAVAEKAREQGCLRVEWATKHENPARKLYDQLAQCDFVEYRLKLD
ncbi:putative acetyltransferase [Myriangium duriaei CBS 260.36]|uniref:Acetyltransferase n=1 Tax=Myriangium duriaei CBS 260.36 TaxID=1168546 RepID=A0A9P4IZN8_9PEZI|nr:putative acetyltransferase [Myriangium duriaei CBS 260.36]